MKFSRRWFHWRRKIAPAPPSAAEDEPTALVSAQPSVQEPGRTPLLLAAAPALPLTPTVEPRIEPVAPAALPPAPAVEPRSIEPVAAALSPAPAVAPCIQPVAPPALPTAPEVEPRVIEPAVAALPTAPTLQPSVPETAVEFPVAEPEAAIELPAATQPTPPLPIEPMELPPSRVQPPVRPLPAVADAEEAQAQLMARLSYFAPASYNPCHASPPKLLASSQSPLPGASPIFGTGVPRAYFAKAAAPAPGVLSAVDPSLLALYLLGREDDPRLEPAWTDLFLRQPEMLASGIKLRNEAIDNWLAGRAPWHLTDFYSRALALAGHAGTALLLCHNVARAFARGSVAIPWIKTDRRCGEYFDGARAVAARILNPLGVLRPGPFSSPSVFHLLFDSRVFGVADSGDWRRYFGSAALAWYIAAKAVVAAPPAAGFGLQWSSLLESIAQQLAGASAGDSRAWTYSNAASFLELSRFGRSGEANRRAARVQLGGAVFGLTHASSGPPAGARWRIPAPAGAHHLDVAPTTVESLDAAGHPAQPASAVAALPAPHPLRESIVHSLLRAVPPGAGAASSLQIVCTVEEGPGCRFAASDWRDPALQSLAESVIDELGWNAMEHAVRRQAALRLSPPSASGQPYACELDLGEGYRPCPVVKGA